MALIAIVFANYKHNLLLLILIIYHIIKLILYTFDIFSMNCTTNFLRPGKVSAIYDALQKTELSQSLSWAFRNHKKCLNSVHDGSVTPQSSKYLHIMKGITGYLIYMIS